MKDDRARLQDILEAIEKAQKYAVKGREAFESDELLQVWIVHHLQIIGEAASKLSQKFYNENPQVPWTQIIGMRNILVHDYFGVDKEVVWVAALREICPS